MGKVNRRDGGMYRSPRGIRRGRTPTTTTTRSVASAATILTRGKNTTRYRLASVADSGCVRWRP